LGDFKIIQNAQWEWDDLDCPIPRSHHYQDIYHSRAGGEAQAQEVFVKGSGFPERFHSASLCTVLETGFGLGLNFLSTWKSWKNSGAACALHYLSIERFPFTKEDLSQLLAPFSSLQKQAEALLAQWILPIPGFHRLVFESGKVILTLGLGDVKELLSEWIGSVDAFYFDGFSPDKNPEMWDKALFKHCAKLAKPGATIATYTVAGHVRRALQEAGFIVERTEGFGGKRHRLQGYYQGFSVSRPRLNRIQKVTHAWPKNRPQRVAVIGAGIAGCSVAERLALRQIEVLLFDKHEAPAKQTSSNRAGVIYPLMTQDNNRSDRVTRAAYLWWQRQCSGWLKNGMVGDFPGVLQLAKSPEHERLMRSTVEAHQWPEAYVQYLDSIQASERVGYAVNAAAYYFPEGGWVNPPSLCQAMLKQAEPYLHTFWNTTVRSIQPLLEGGWLIESMHGSHQVDQVVLANAWESLELLPAEFLQFKRIFGQVHDVDPPVLSELNMVVCQDGYVIPSSSGYGCMGATFEWDEAEKLSSELAHQSNVRRVLSMFPTFSSTDLPLSKGRAGWRTSAKDRLPIVGSLSSLWKHCTNQDAQGLWSILALGSRGLVWGPLSGELIASACCVEPLPIEYSLYAALSPLRFTRSHE
jgi:tRNA 5-methylaminomethyl-2-thiouridine biosynthesis bifunctional protein